MGDSRRVISREELESYRDPENIGKPPFDVPRMRPTRTGWVVETEHHWYSQTGIEWLTVSWRRYHKDFYKALADLEKREARQT